MKNITWKRQYGYVGPVKRQSYLILSDGEKVCRWIPAYKELQRALRGGRSYERFASNIESLEAAIKTVKSMVKVRPSRKEKRVWQS
jgi:hypothetical protein